MKTRKLGSLEVTIVGLGCNNFGGRIDEAATQAVVNATLDAGINFFDTADNYGKSLSEQYLGRALGVRRKDVLIATKFGGHFDGQPTGANPARIVPACDASLARLGTDYIDLYQLHVPDLEVPIADVLGVLDGLVKAGKVREIGCSNFDVAQLQELERVHVPGAAKFVSLQNHYSLFHREPEGGVLAECGRQGLGFLPYFPLASGLLTGKYRKGGAHPTGTRIASDSDRLSERTLATVEALIAFAEARHRTILDLAVSWLLMRPEVSSVIAGATKPEQVFANANAASWLLSDSEMAEIDTILSPMVA